MSEQVFGFTLSQYSTPILRTLLRFANVHFQEYLDKSSLFSLLMYFESMLNDDECIRLTQVLRAAVRSGAEKNLYKVKVEFRNLALDDKGQKSAGQKQSQKKPGQESNVIRPRTQIHIRSVERSMPRSMRECPVCNEFLPESFFAWRKITKSCRHPPEFCLRCLQKAISAQLDERSFNKLTCPHIACRELLQGGYVEMWATPDTFDRYCDQRLRYALGLAPNFQRCLNPSCTFEQYHDDPESQMMTCYKCGFVMCIKHQDLWHDNRACEECDAELKLHAKHQAKHEQENEASLRYISDTFKKCPECSIPIENSGGSSNRITCANCDYAFCWACLAPWLDNMLSQYHLPPCYESARADNTPTTYNYRPLSMLKLPGPVIDIFQGSDSARKPSVSEGAPGKRYQTPPSPEEEESDHEDLYSAD